MIRVFPSGGGGMGGSPYEPYVPPHKNGVPLIKSESCPPSSLFIMAGTCRIFFYHRTDYTNLTNSEFKDDSVIHDSI